MEVSTEAMVKIVDHFYNGYLFDAKALLHFVKLAYHLAPPNRFWAADAAAALVNQQLTQGRLAEVLGDVATTNKIATANRREVDQFVDRLLAVPFAGFGGIIVVVVPAPVPPHWDDLRLPDGASGFDLLLAAGQFQKAAALSAAKSEGSGVEAKSEYVTAAARLFKEGLYRIEAKSE